MLTNRTRKSERCLPIGTDSTCISDPNVVLPKTRSWLQLRTRKTWQTLALAMETLKKRVLVVQRFKVLKKCKSAPKLDVPSTSETFEDSFGHSFSRSIVWRGSQGLVWPSMKTSFLGRNHVFLLKTSQHHWNHSKSQKIVKKTKSIGQGPEAK